MTVTNVLLGIIAAELGLLTAVNVGPLAYLWLKLFIAKHAHPGHGGHGRRGMGGLDDERVFQLTMTPEELMKHLPYLEKEGLVQTKKLPGKATDAENLKKGYI